MGVENVPSRRVAEKTGMTLEKEGVENRYGGPMVVYSIENG